MTTSPDRILAITDLLLGASHADGVHRGDEEAALRKLLRGWLKADELPEAVDERIESFKIASFDVKKAAADFAGDPADSKRKLLELVAAVRDADGEVDLDEDAYLHDVARALGVAEDAYADLVLSIDIDMDFSENVAALRKGPPPIPKK